MIATESANQSALRPESPIHLPQATCRVVLTGFMGAGKSTVGRILAARLGWAFLDLDSYVEQRERTTIPKLFADLGEPRFRRFESSALASALSQTSVVIALGGGTPEIHTNRLLVEQTPGTLTILLDAPFSVLFDRCVLQSLTPASTERPLLTDAPAALTRFHLRHPLYRRIARFIQQTEDLTPTQTVDGILAQLSTCQ